MLGLKRNQHGLPNWNLPQRGKFRSVINDEYLRRKVQEMCRRDIFKPLLKEQQIGVSTLSNPERAQGMNSAKQQRPIVLELSLFMGALAFILSVYAIMN